MSSRVVIALVAVLILGGGSIAFVVWRAGAERADRVAAVIASVSAEMSAEHDPDSLRLLLRRIRSVREEVADQALQAAEGRVLLALGRTQEAWDTVRPLATAPGASDDALEVGAAVLTRLQAGTGDLSAGRQALAMADEHARRTGSSASRFAAWQLASRIGEVPTWVALSTEIVATEERPFAPAVRAGVEALAGALADRIGVERRALTTAAEGDAGALAQAIELRVDPRASVGELDDLVERFDGGLPELEIVAAMRVLDEFGGMGEEEARGAEAESLLRDALARTDRVLDRYAASVEARHLAVVALIALRQSFALDDTQFARYRGHLQWLVRNAPQSHVQRPLWQRLASELPR